MIDPPVPVEQGAQIWKGMTAMRRTIKILIPVLAAVIIAAAVFVMVLNKRPLQGRDLLTDPEQLVQAIEGKTREEIYAILGEPDNIITDARGEYVSPNGDTVTMLYDLKTDLLWKVETEEDFYLFSSIERTEEAMALIDDLELLAQTVEGMAYAQVVELLGEPDWEASGPYTYSWCNSQHKATAINCSSTVSYVSSGGRNIYFIEFDERSEEAQRLLDDPDALAEALRGQPHDALFELLGIWNVQDSKLYYKSYYNSAGESILVWLDPETYAPRMIETKDRTISLEEE